MEGPENATNNLFFPLLEDRGAGPLKSPWLDSDFSDSVSYGLGVSVLPRREACFFAVCPEPVEACCFQPSRREAALGLPQLQEAGCMHRAVGAGLHGDLPPSASARAFSGL